MRARIMRKVFPFFLSLRQGSRPRWKLYTMLKWCTYKLTFLSLDFLLSFFLWRFFLCFFLWCLDDDDVCFSFFLFLLLSCEREFPPSPQEPLPSSLSSSRRLIRLLLSVYCESSTFSFSLFWLMVSTWLHLR